MTCLCVVMEDVSVAGQGVRSGVAGAAEAAAEAVIHVRQPPQKVFNLHALGMGQLHKAGRKLNLDRPNKLKGDSKMMVSRISDTSVDQVWSGILEFSLLCAHLLSSKAALSPGSVISVRP